MTFLIVLAAFALAMLGMSLGVLLSNRRLTGTCGGLAGLVDENGDTACVACQNPSPTCSGLAENARKDR